MHPALLLLLGGGVLIASRKKKRKAAPRGKTTPLLQAIPIEDIPVTKVLPLLQAAVLYEIDNTVLKDMAKQMSGVPLFDGFPTGIVPNGYEAIDMSTDRRQPGMKAGYGPDPARFTQWGQLEESDAFMRKYAFGVVGGGKLNFYVIGRPTARNNCCELVRCRKSASEKTPSGKSSSEKEQAWSASGPVEQYQDIMDGWKCDCEKHPSECFDLMERPFVNWPLAQTEPP
jgi:hypothetical protein